MSDESGIGRSMPQRSLATGSLSASRERSTPRSRSADRNRGKSLNLGDYRRQTNKMNLISAGMSLACSLVR
jgi:hypothetical protein